MSVLSTLNNGGTYDRRKLAFAITSSVSLTIWIYTFYQRRSRFDFSSKDSLVASNALCQFPNIESKIQLNLVNKKSNFND